MRRQIVSISAALMVAAVTLAGCSSGSHHKSAAAKQPALAPAAAGQPVGTAALKAMLLTPAEAGGGWSAAQPVRTSDDVQLDSRGVALTSGGPACQATANVLAGVPPYGASTMAETVARNADRSGAFAQLLTVLRPADARYVVPHLRDTIRGCDGEVTFTPWPTSFQLGDAKDGGKYAITGADSPFLGDDSAGFSIAVPGATLGPNGAPATAEVTVVRVGAVIAYYVHVGDVTDNTLVTAAVAKLKNAASPVAGA